MPPAELDGPKAAAAAAALDMVEDGMLVGLGSGTTSAIFVELLARRVRAGLRVAAVATSTATAAQAVAGGIPVVDEIDRPIDLAVDGADEIDPALNLLKGRGGALVREKLVALAAREFVVVADDSKLVSRLGAAPVPVEVLPFLWRQTAARVERLAASWTVRGGEARPFVTDNSNLVLDCWFVEGIEDPRRLGEELKSIPGVVDHGIFAGIASAAIVGGAGGVRRLAR